jgi:hypothetical protein
MVCRSVLTVNTASMGTVKSSWANGSNVPESAMKSSSRASSGSSKAARATRLTARASIARRPVPRVSGFSALTQSTSVNTQPSNTLLKYRCESQPANQSFKITCSLLFQSELLTTFDSLDYMHHANPTTPIEETMRALAELKA